MGKSGDKKSAALSTLTNGTGKCQFCGKKPGIFRLEYAHIVPQKHLANNRNSFPTRNAFALCGCSTTKGTCHHLFDGIVKPLIRALINENEKMEKWLQGDYLILHHTPAAIHEKMISTKISKLIKLGPETPCEFPELDPVVILGKLDD